MTKKVLTRWTDLVNDLSTVARMKPKAVWNVERITADMSLRGWNTHALAQAAGLSVKTVDRFLRGQVQTPKTAAAISIALGHATKRYFSHVEAVA